MTGINFCRPIFEAAQRHPERPALTVPGTGGGPAQTWTYAAFVQAVAQQQHALQAQGLSTGDRVLLLARPGIHLYVLMIAMLGLGIVPVMVERGMPRAKLRAVLRQAGLKAVLGEQAVLRWWPVFPALWRLPLWALDGATWGVRSWPARLPHPSHTTPPDTPLQAIAQPLPQAAHGIITFTSGSTGLPKGADRTHASLLAQHHAIRAHWPDQSTDIDLPSFPVLVLHNLCCGIQTVLPDTDLAFPAQVAAKSVLAQITAQRITRLTGSPAYLRGLTDRAVQQGLTFAGVRSVVIGGATLTRPLAQRCRQVFPLAEILIVYGSTEAEPIAEVRVEELLADWDQHPGHLVGSPASNTHVRIVSMDADLASEHAVDAASLPAGQEGEVLVAGAHVLQAYVDNPSATAENKIPRADGLVWHRTGDTAIQDAQGRLWLTGRLADRLNVHGQHQSAYPIEKALDALDGVIRSAVINHPKQPGQTVVVLQGQPHDTAAALALLRQFKLSHALLCTVPHMPVDIRHNSKLDRPTLRERLKQGALSTQPIGQAWKTAA